MTLVVIPARMASTRLPGKPLALIGGRPMIAWMVDIAHAAGVGPVAAAVCEPEVAAAAEAAGAQAVMTDPALPSGTDRIHAAARIADPEGRHDVIVNLQGDMPTFDPAALALATALLAETPEADIATLAAASEADEDRRNPNVVKAIIALQGAKGRALYFTRAAAPHGEGPIYRHVGLYVFRRAALERFVTAAPSALEKRESLEQLRALEMGMRIEVGLTDSFPKGVDSPADLDAARTALGA